MLRRRSRSNVADIEAARAARNATGAYDPSAERREYLGPYTSLGFDDHSPASSAAGEHRQGLSLVPHVVESPCSTSIAESCREVDELRALLDEEINANIDLDRENRRLRSERDQAVAQLRIAREKLAAARKGRP